MPHLKVSLMLHENKNYILFNYSNSNTFSIKSVLFKILIFCKKQYFLQKLQKHFQP